MVTSIPFQSTLLSPITAIEAPRTSRLKPTHKRNGSSVSTISFPSPAALLFNYGPTTPKTPGTNVAFPSLLSPNRLPTDDGRQSRMAIRSPIVERVVSLPLRVNTSARTPPAEPQFPNPPNSLASSQPCSDAMSISPSSEWLPVNPLTPLIQVSAPSTYTPSHSPSDCGTTLVSELTRTTTRKQLKRPRSPPPHYHMTVAPSLSSTLNNPDPSQPVGAHPFTLQPGLRTAYFNAVNHLTTPLVPLISVTTGLPHPSFPRSLLQYHLLTHQQLDSLARWYHQSEPAIRESFDYPAWIPPYTNRDGSDTGFEEVPLSTKRRRWGRFIGLRGCESPTVEESEEALVERMEREWQRARERARDEEIAREKGWRGRW